MKRSETARRHFLMRSLTGSRAALLAGCDRLSRTESFSSLLHSAEKLTHATQCLTISRRSMAQEFTEADLSPMFRSNGTSNPDNRQYQALAANGFAGYSLKIYGLVERP